MTSFSLRQVKLRPGEQYRDELEVELPAFEFGGQRYVPVPEKVPAEFEITRANTGTAGGWDLRLVFGTRLWVGGEIAYVGAAQSINNLGLASSSTLVRNGIEGVLRINAPLHAGATLLEPYIFGGVGWNLYDVNASTVTADLNVSDNTLTVPAGLGFSVGYQGFMADIRGTYRPTYFQQLFINQSDTALTNWAADLTIGYEF